MKIKFDVDSDLEQEKVTMELSNDNLNNLNFVSIWVEEREYIVSTEDLYRAAKLFYEQREDNKD